MSQGRKSHFFEPTSQKSIRASFSTWFGEAFSGVEFLARPPLSEFIDFAFTLDFAIFDDFRDFHSKNRKIENLGCQTVEKIIFPTRNRKILSTHFFFLTWFGEAFLGVGFLARPPLSEP